MVSNKEVFCQQVLQPDGTVFSVQYLDFSKGVAAGVDARSVMERYFAFIRSHTLGFVRPAVALGGGVEFRFLWFRLSLLSFAPPRYECAGNSTAVHLDMAGGVLMQGPCAGGLFSILTEEGEEEAVRVTVRLDSFRPALLGCTTPTVARTLLYRVSQAWVHKRATVAFLMCFYREVSGVKASAELKGVRLREGRAI